jgi:hypothetical protein
MQQPVNEMARKGQGGLPGILRALLRQRIDWVLIVCPASVTLQWKTEMERRFGLAFEIYNRDFVKRRRQERGFQVNAWGTHNCHPRPFGAVRRRTTATPAPLARCSRCSIPSASCLAPWFRDPIRSRP